MKGFVSLTRASLIGFGRDRSALLWTLLFPIVLIGLFALLFGGPNAAAAYKIQWVDEAHTAGAAAARSTFEQSGSFTIDDNPLNLARNAMHEGHAKAIVRLPATFDGTPTGARAELIIDPSDRGSSGVIASLAANLIRPAPGGPAAAIDIQPLNDQILNPASYFVPTILAMALMQLGILGAVTLVQQRERQILKRLAAAPVARWSVIGSIAASRLVVAIMQTILMLIAGTVIIGALPVGNVFALAGIVTLSAATFIAMGFALSGLARTEESATSLTSMVTLPLMFLSGVFIPIEQLPDVVRPVAVVLPLTYAGDALRQIMVGGTPYVPIAVAVAVLGAWLVGSLVVATRTFRWY